MTREDTLIAMNGATLIGVADRLGVKAACNKSRTALKESKAKVIARILEAEAAQAAQNEQQAPETTEEPQETPETVEAEAPAETTETAETQEPEAEEADAPAEAQEPETTEEPKQPEKKARKARVQKPAVPAAESEEAVEAVKVLIDTYDKLNDMYFDSLLPDADIVLGRTRKSYDPCTVGKDEATGQYEIAVCASVIGKPIIENAVALLHAMVHIYCQETGIVETCQKGRYHNNKFKKECEDRDLIVDYDSANGYVYTTAGDLFAENLKTAGVDLEQQLAPIPANKKN